MQRKFRWVECGLVLGLLALASSCSVRGHSGSANQAETQPLKRTAIVFQEFYGQLFPFPLARVRVAGESTWMVVDTGSTHHVLADWLVRKLALTSRPSVSTGQGHMGDQVQVRNVDLKELDIEGWGAVPTPALISIQLPSVYEKLGVGGVLSPQLLGEAGAAVQISFPQGEMRLVPAASPAEPRTQSYFGTRVNTDVCAAAPQSGQATQYLVPLTVDGRSVRLLLDTGAPETDLREADSVVRDIARGRSVTRETRTPMTSSAKVQVGELKGVVLSVGTLRQVLDLALIPGISPPDCPSQGHLGLSVLRECSLLLQEASFSAECRPAP